MTNNTIFKDLYVLDMANNHEGDVELGMRIIDEAAAVAQKRGIKASVKFQYRELDSFIHPDFKDADAETNKHIPRFLANRITFDDFKKMLDRVREHGMTTIVTPFDEASVKTCVEHDVDIIKVASCSATDWPLLEAIAETKKSVIVSTGGLKLNQIDDVVSFFAHKGINFALMHCVAIYPTPSDKVNMNFMGRMMKRYPRLVIGYSGHEEPSNLDVGKSAIGKSAQMLERHVGVTTEKKPELNKYSMNPAELDMWVEAMEEAKVIGGSSDDKYVTQEEADSLASLARGVWAKKDIKEGEVITRDDVFFAMPIQKGQLTSGEFGAYRATYKATRAYKANDAIIEERQADPIKEVRTVVHDMKGMFHEANIEVGDTAEIELSHHHGIEQFRDVGAMIVNVINREYCKKLIALLPGQKHPSHMHKTKEETFHVLWGEMTVMMNGKKEFLKPGDTMVVERGVWHSFETETGVIFEEVSTTSIRGDSYYEDPKVRDLDPMERKTVLESW